MRIVRQPGDTEKAPVVTDAMPTPSPGLTGGLPKINPLVKMRELNNALGSNSSQLPFDSMTIDPRNEDVLESKNDRGSGTIGTAPKARRESDPKPVRKTHEKVIKDYMATASSNRRSSNDQRAGGSERAQNDPITHRRLRITSLALSPSVTHTEEQLSGSRSNYEILYSGDQSYRNSSFQPSLWASVNSRRAQHQRKEQTRRDRLKCALEALADILPHGRRAQAGAGSAGSRNISKAKTVEIAIEYIRELHTKYDVETDERNRALQIESKDADQHYLDGKRLAA